MNSTLGLVGVVVAVAAVCGVISTGEPVAVRAEQLCVSASVSGTVNYYHTPSCFDVMVETDPLHQGVDGSPIIRVDVWVDHPS